MFVIDLGHYLDLPTDVPEPARRLAKHLNGIVEHATRAPAGRWWTSTIACTQRPGRRRCPATLELHRTDLPATIEWNCPSCGDNGIIRGWEHSPADRRSSVGETPRPVV